MSRRRTTAKQTPGEEPDERRPRRRNRALRRLTILLVLCAGLLALAPMLIAHSPLRDTLLNWQLPPGGWQVRSEEAALSWLGAQSLTNVAITDPTGRPLLSLQSLTLNRSLLKLATDSSDLGKLQLIRPTILVRIDGERNNLEDFYQALVERSGSSIQGGEAKALSPTALAIEIIEGTLKGVNATDQQQWAIEQANLTAQLGAEITAEGTAVLSYAPGDTGGKVRFRVLPTADNRQQLDLSAEGLALDSLGPWVSRWLAGCRLAGSTALEAHVTWQSGGEAEQVVDTWGRAETNQFLLSADAIQQDQVRCDKLVIPWKFRTTPAAVIVEELKVDAGWSRLAAHGSLTWDELQGLAAMRLPAREFSLAGDLSLAKLAAMLPHTLALREGVQVDSGQVQFNAAATQQADGLGWSGQASLTDLAGFDRGRAIRWDQPVKVSADWKDSAGGPRLDRFALTAPFAGAEFATSAEGVSGEFHCDLGQLAEGLGQFVDLGELKARGTAAGTLQLSANPQQAFQATADFTLRDLDLQQAQATLWQEPQLTVHLQAAGKAEQFVPQTLSSATADLAGRRDSLQVKLVEPVQLAAGSRWTLGVESSGFLDDWTGRLRPWLGEQRMEIAGEATLAGQVILTADAVEARNVEGSVKLLHLRTNRQSIDEPQVQVSGDVRWNRSQNRFDSQRLLLRGSTLAFESQDLHLELAKERVPVLTGNVAFSTNLGRLALASGLADATWPEGIATGKLRLATNAEQVLADFQLSGEQLQLVRAASAGGPGVVPPSVVWSEPRLQASGKAVYTIARQQANLENLHVEGQTLQLTGDVRWDQPLASGPITVAGNLQYDPAALSQLVASYAGPEVHVQGDRTIRFELRRQLAASPANNAHWSRTWQGTAEAGWTTAAVFGLPISTGKLQGTLAEGQLRIAPLDLAVGQGKLTASPLVTLDPPPSAVTLPAGPLFSEVQISPEVSEKMLKYAAPILAGATRVDGQFSVDLAATQVPLDNLKQLHTAGKLKVHQLKVLPGPILSDLVNIVRQLRSLEEGKDLLQAAVTPQQPKLLTMQDQEIEFQVTEGRVYHRNLEFIVDRVPIRSQGSVGFDQSLALVIEIPIQDRWIGDRKGLQSLAGQTIQVPIQGTFQKPQVDQQAVADITRQLVRQTAREAIGSEINRQFEKLFNKKDE